MTQLLDLAATIIIIFTSIFHAFMGWIVSYGKLQVLLSLARSLLTFLSFGLLIITSTTTNQRKHSLPCSLDDKIICFLLFCKYCLMFFSFNFVLKSIYRNSILRANVAYPSKHCCIFPSSLVWSQITLLLAKPYLHI